ncbi:MAG: adenosine kinase [Kordiimonadaceae bacterium]|nr:adenosine kinase [Kordiimonadaceae bacterium]MBT6035368.1 adenosine kinase [Kordiimonadaceae bacterium]MBT6329513.1 adenosine kinase [Kordiimonadaceae bacterium]MBT7583662.1 adenosine kinase [Kordiimonadaceae bacterium]
MANKYDVLGIGNAIVDVLTHVTDDFLVSENLTKGSMTLVSEQEAANIYEKLGQGIECSGGSAANTIAGLASMGSRTSYMGKVKDDQLGTVFQHDIKSLGTHFGTSAENNGPSTAHCLVLVTPDAERTMCTYLGACVNLTEDDIDEQTVRDANIIYLEGYLWDPEPAKAAFRKAIKIAHDAGNKVALSLSDSFCVGRHHAEFLALVKDGVDILFANEDEIKMLYATDDVNEAALQAQQDCHIAAITCGAKGCIVTHADEIGHVQGRNVEKLVDTTGAGDLFAAGFLHALSNGRSIGECGALGNLVAGEVITHLGARPDIDLKKFVEDNA